MNDLFVNNNGVLINADAYALKSGNRGHLYGDGLFESIRVFNGELINFSNHYNRLINGMIVLKMKCQSSFTEEFLRVQIIQLIEQNNIIEGGKIRLSVDRKQGGRLCIFSGMGVEVCLIFSKFWMIFEGGTHPQHPLDPQGAKSRFALNFAWILGLPGPPLGHLWAHFSPLGAVRDGTGEPKI